MPTWYTNTLLILGPRQEDASHFRDAVLPLRRPGRSGRSALSLAALAPADGSYRSRLARWGTPWDVHATLYEGCEALEYSFRSAVGPPLPWLRDASAAFPTLKFLLQYRGTDGKTAGYARAQAGTGDDVRSSFGRFFRHSARLRTLAEL